MRNKFADVHAHYFGDKSTFGGILMVLGLGGAPRSFVKEYWNIPYPTPENVVPLNTTKSMRELAALVGLPEDTFLNLPEPENYEINIPEFPDS